MRIIVLAGGWLLGVYLGAELGLPAALAIGAAVALLAGLLFASLTGPRRRWLLAALAVAGALTGVLRFDLHDAGSDLGGLAGLHGSPVELRGYVDSHPERAGTALRFELRVEEARGGGDWRETEGRVLVTARPPAALTAAREHPFFHQGDAFWLAGEIEAPRRSGDFDFPRYLAQQGVGSVMAFPRLELRGTGQGPWLDRALFTVRSEIAGAVARTLPEPQASLAQALTVGVRSDIPADVVRGFRDSGAAHLLAISGLHVGMALMMTLALARRFAGRPRWLVFALPLLAVWGYAVLAGLPPSAQRAAVMATFYLAALYFGRQRHGLTALMLAALVLTAFDPGMVWEVSFQLSFLAMAGIVVVGPWITERIEWGGGGGALDAVVRFTARAGVAGFAATLLTWPVVAFYFHQVALTGIPVTVLALPLLPIALAFSLLAGALGVVSEPAAWLFAWGGWAALGLLAWTTQLFAALSFSNIQVGEVSRVLVAAYYAALGAVALATAKAAPLVRAAGKLPFPTLPRVEIGPFGLAAAALVTASALVWTAALRGPDEMLEVTFADVGQGDAILVRTPSRHTLLVDGGPSPAGALDALGAVLPFWDRGIDVLVLTHADVDHSGGLAEIAARYEVGLALEPGTPSDGAERTAWKAAVERAGAPVSLGVAGQRIILGETTVEVLHPPPRPLLGTGSDGNNNSIVLRVVYGDVSFLLTGDIEALGERFLLDQGAGLESTVLKAAHHGSATSSTASFVERVAPAAAVISVGADNRLGHPDPDVVSTLREAVGGNLFTTADHGPIRFRTDGVRLWVERD